MIKNNLELIIGPVCSGKSAEFLRRVDRYQIAGYNICLIKPSIDTRASTIKSRFGKEMQCLNLNSLSEIDKHISYDSVDIIAIDEAQFFKDVFNQVKRLMHSQYKVIVSALDTDFNGLPFGEIPQLITLSDSVIKLTAICMRCFKDNAIYSQKLKKGGCQIEVGDIELYVPSCFNCFQPGGTDDFFAWKGLERA